MPAEGDATGNWETWMPTASVIGANSAMKSLSKCASWPFASSGAPGPLPSPDAPYTCGIRHTSLLFSVPFKGHMPCAEAVPATDRKARVSNARSSRFDIEVPSCVKSYAENRPYDTLWELMPTPEDGRESTLTPRIVNKLA